MIGGAGNDEASKVTDSDDLNVAAEPSPTHSEALQACMLLKRYIIDMDDPAAQKLDVTLGPGRYRRRLD